MFLGRVRPLTLPRKTRLSRRRALPSPKNKNGFSRNVYFQQYYTTVISLFYSFLPPAVLPQTDILPHVPQNRRWVLRPITLTRRLLKTQTCPVPSGVTWSTPYSPPLPQRHTVTEMVVLLDVPFGILAANETYTTGWQPPKHRSSPPPATPDAGVSYETHLFILGGRPKALGPSQANPASPSLTFFLLPKEVSRQGGDTTS